MKFRIWNKTLNKFVPPEEWYINGNGTVYYYDVMDGELIQAASGNCVVQRSTGLKDKNGKDIWEGDIVTYDTGYTYSKKMSEVLFRNGIFDPVPNLATTWGTSIDSKSFIVVGNIFENPELLN